MPDVHELKQPSQEDAAPTGRSELYRRVLSALILAIAALVTAALGSLPFLLFWAGAALWVWWEWVGLIKAEPRKPLLAIGGIAIAGMAITLSLRAPALAFACVVIGTTVVAVTAYPHRSWAAGGVLYASALLIPCVLLRNDAVLGLSAILWLFAAVWSADIAAYFSGRYFGGPLLAVRISPKKTWSGTLGGMIAGSAAGLAVLYAEGISLRAMHVVLTLGIVIASQLGDLFESAIKRNFGVKDASYLIPGHGGLMDRVDGFVAAALVALLFGQFRAGATSPATGLLQW